MISRFAFEKSVTSILAVIAFVSMLAIWDWVKRGLETPPIEWYGVDVMTPEVTVGGDLKLVFDAKINEQCPSEIWAFLRRDDGTVVRRWVTHGGYTKTSYGKKKIPVTIRIQGDQSGLFAPIGVGRYVYSASILRFCPGGLMVDNNVPAASFKIVKG